MAVDCAVLQQAVNTSTGNQDFTKAGFGTPKACIFWLSAGVTNGTAANGALFCIGAADDTREVVSCVQSEHNVSVVNCDRRQATDETIMMLTSAAAIDGEANFVSFITDGVRLNVADAFASAYLATVLLFGGSDCSAYVDADTHTLGQDVAQSFTAPNFEPDLTFFFGTGGAFNDTSGNDLMLSAGWAVDDGTITQGALIGTIDDGDSTTTPATRVQNNRVFVSVNTNTGNISRSLEYTSTLATGFQLTKREAAFGLDFAYLALGCGGAVNFGMNHFTSPTSTGTLSRTAFGWTPQMVMLLPSFCDTVNDRVITGSGGAGCFALSAFDATDATCTGISHEDNVSTTNEQSLAHDRPLYVARDDGTVVFDGTFDNFTANGYDLDITTTDGTARNWMEIGIEENAAAAAPDIVGAYQFMASGGMIGAQII